MRQSVDQFIEFLPEEQKKIINKVRDILCKQMKLIESTKYHIPFYSKKKNIAYINPSRCGLVLGICCGSALYKHHDVLVGNQKAVRHYPLKSIQDIDEQKIKEIIRDAIEFYG